ncbi:hypothetical protein D3C80_1139830 [compost metagenome]
MPVGSGSLDSRLQGFRRSVVSALGNTQALAGNQRAVDIVGVQQDARPVPVAQLLHAAHGVLGVFQALVQGRHAGVLQPCRTLDARGTGLAANVFELHQVPQPRVAITAAQCQARCQHMADDQGVGRTGLAGLGQHGHEQALGLRQFTAFILQQGADGVVGQPRSADVPDLRSGCLQALQGSIETAPGQLEHTVDALPHAACQRGRGLSEHVPGELDVAAGIELQGQGRRHHARLAAFLGRQLPQVRQGEAATGFTLVRHAQPQALQRL